MTISPDDRQTLIEELDLLRQRRNELEESFENDDHPHDAGEQSEATERRDELDWSDRRIQDITYLLHAASWRDNVPPGRVGVGSLVTLRYPDGRAETSKVTAVPDEDLPDITADSPLGRALLGAAVGEEISWGAPEGRLSARVAEVQGPASDAEAV